MEVSYKTIIDSYEFDHQEHNNINLELENKKRVLDTRNPLFNFDYHSINYFSKNITIPPIIKNINPKLKEKEYITLKKDPNFLHKITSVCEECFLIIAKGNIAGGDYNIQRVRTNESTKLFGTGRLRPETLKYRNNLTLRNIKYKTLIEDLRPDIKPQIINHLISPTKLFSSDKLFEIESERNISLKPKNDLVSNLYDNIIELPLRGSIRNSIRNSFSNPKFQENSQSKKNYSNNDGLNQFPLAHNDEFVKRKLENVKEINDHNEDEEQNEENESFDDNDNQSPGNFIEDITAGLTLKTKDQQNYQENNENSENIVEKTEENKEKEDTQNNNNEKNSQNSNSFTDRNSKFLNTSDNLRKVFIPNLKNTTNSCYKLCFFLKFIYLFEKSYKIVCSSKAYSFKAKF